MTGVSVAALQTTLVAGTVAPTTLVAALDLPLVLEIAPQGATLAVTVMEVGVLVAPAAQGPTGPQGAAGPQGPQGAPGNATTTVFTVPNPSVSWMLAHELNRYPAVTLVDTSGNLVLADIVYIDANTIEVAFGFATAGTAYLN